MYPALQVRYFADLVTNPITVKISGNADGHSDITLTIIKDAALTLEGSELTTGGVSLLQLNLHLIQMLEQIGTEILLMVKIRLLL